MNTLQVMFISGAAVLAALYAYRCYKLLVAIEKQNDAMQAALQRLETEVSRKPLVDLK